MKPKKKIETKKRWETPVIRTLPFKSTLGGSRTYYNTENALYS